ncbi:hypothetical protein [Mesorhizobium sp. AA22]|uniref:hypothetical protein n=1 Tax=Mesorhizobium sp. AA22 TaxID=1854057 RepID=UPI000A794822|nr:hypothetical protein [Mesorhizobium sp. AA22]
MLGNDRRGNAEYVVVKATEAAAKPERLTHVEAAAVRLAGIQHGRAFSTMATLKSGQRVLIHGGAGVVGHQAIQFAKAAGAFVVTTVAANDFDFAPRGCTCGGMDRMSAGCVHLRGRSNCFSIRYTVADKGPDRASMKSSPGRSESTHSLHDPLCCRRRHQHLAASR